YYNPSTGRWLSRDPLEERGGESWYVFCNNDAVTHRDVFGLSISSDIEDAKATAAEFAAAPLETYSKSKVDGYKLYFAALKGIPLVEGQIKSQVSAQVEMSFRQGIKDPTLALEFFKRY